MAGSTAGPTQNQNQNQSSQTQPWAPTIPSLENIINQVNGVNTSVTPQQQQAGQNLVDAGSSIPNYGPTANSVLQTILSGNNLGPMQTVSGAYNSLQTGMQPALGALGSYLGSGYTDPFSNPGTSAVAGTLSSYLNPNFTNPMSNPAMQSVLDTIQEDVGNSVRGAAGAAGRSFSGDEDKALARGISQGESSALMNEYNSLAGLQQGATGQLGGLYNSLAGQQQNAANSTGGLLASLFGAGNTTAQTIANLATNENQNWLSALGAANALPGLYTQGPSAQLQALATQMGIPVQNLQNTLGPLLSIAGLGAEATGTGTSTSTSSPLLNTLLGALALGGGAYGAFKSDRRSKENIKQVGALFDGLPVFSFSYKDDPLKRAQIGLMAQDVEQRYPEAVVEDQNHIKYVRYDLATLPSTALA